MIGLLKNCLLSYFYFKNEQLTKDSPHQNLMGERINREDHLEGGHAVGLFISVHALQAPTMKSICGFWWMLSNAAHKHCWLERDAGCPPSSSQVFMEAHHGIETVPGYRSAKGKRGGGVRSGIVEHSSVGRPGLRGVHIERDSFTKPMSEGFLLLRIRVTGRARWEGATLVKGKGTKDLRSPVRSWSFKGVIENLAAL